jgi:hypothetical protein
LQLSERFELDLLEVVTRDEYMQMPIVVVNGLLDVLVLMLTDTCRRRPGDVPAILAPLLDQLRSATLSRCAPSSARPPRSSRATNP